MSRKSCQVRTSKANRDAGRSHALPHMATRELVKKAWRAARKDDIDGRRQPSQ